MQNEPVTPLQVDELEIWRGERRLVHGLSFLARAGDVIHLKGPNGSGKTSVLRCLAGLSLPDEGAVSWFGMRYTGRIGPEARARLRYVGHQDALKGGLDARENLRALQSLFGDTGDIDAALAEAGLASRADVPAQRLSAGQRRRVALSRLHAGRAEAWLLDEPFTSLDVEGIERVAGWIAAHAAGGGIVVLSTHQPLPASLQPTVIPLGAAA